MPYSTCQHMCLYADMRYMFWRNRPCYACVITWLIWQFVPYIACQHMCLYTGMHYLLWRNRPCHTCVVTWLIWQLAPYSACQCLYIDMHYTLWRSRPCRPALPKLLCMPSPRTSQRSRSCMYSSQPAHDNGYFAVGLGGYFAVGFWQASYTVRGRYYTWLRMGGLCKRVVHRDAQELLF